MPAGSGEGYFSRKAAPGLPRCHGVPTSGHGKAACASTGQWADAHAAGLFERDLAEHLLTEETAHLLVAGQDRKSVM